MGVESGSQAVLNAMDKGLNLPSVIAARGLLKNAGIRACYFLQFGYPGETWTELQETIGCPGDTAGRCRNFVLVPAARHGVL
jgi:radical SAM superfamily enzyme YgiQ (UPF0313 family)